MTGSSILIAALLIAAPPVGQPQQDAAQPAPPASGSAAPGNAAVEDANAFNLARRKLAQCPGERFDFQVADRPGAKGTQVALCSNAGAAKEQIAAMLESAIRQLQTTDRMAAEDRDQIIVQIRAKLVEVQAR